MTFGELINRAFNPTHTSFKTNDTSLNPTHTSLEASYTNLKTTKTVSECVNSSNNILQCV